MGGCRCTYRNCSVKYDGKTHMFHYPVFDKIRCHQWLQNSHRLDFLNLKVSQLKNRVVCQHHFKPDNFMNYKMDKLIFDAIPTEDGPYCDPTKCDYNVLKKEALKYPITVEDIENECYMTGNDKKANMSMKYADFLTNNELVDLNLLPSDKTLITSENKDNRLIISNNLDEICTSNNFATEINNKSQPVLRVEPYSEGDNAIINSNNIIPIESQIREYRKNPAVSSANTLQIKEENTNVHGNQLDKSNKSTRKKENVKIISQKKICEPVKITGNLQPVSPSLVLRPKKKREVQSSNIKIASDTDNKIEITILPTEFSTNQITCNDQLDPMLLINNNITENFEENKSEQIPLLSEIYERNINTTVEDYKSQKMSIDTDKFNKNNTSVDEYIFEKVSLLNKNKSPKVTPETKKTQIKVTPIKRYISKVDNSCKELSPNLSLLKNKIPPERVAEIEEKRKFNMKLRDIIEAELNHLEENERQVEVNNHNKDIDKKRQTKKNAQESVYQFISNASELPNISEYTFARIDATIKKVENNLLNKIEQNAKRIVELRNTITGTNKRFSVSTQTLMSEELQKKNLYNEISKYLSPQANSLIYEELFLNKYTHNNVLASSEEPKRRRYR